MTKRSSRRSAEPTLFESVEAAPEQQQGMTLLLLSLQADIVRFEQQLSRPLASWEQREQQVIEANAALDFAFRSLASFFPAGDLQSLVHHFVDLRARLVLRAYHEQEG